MIRALVLALLVSKSSWAKTFQNSYIRIDLPDSWSCVQEGIAWVCSPANSSDAREALIVATAKLAGPEDNLNAFLSYLRQPKTVISNSRSTLSQPLSIDRRKAAGVEWVQAMHRGSEVPNFLTRYMATVKEKLAVLVSFSADEESVAKYNKVFDAAIRSMQIDPTKPFLIQLQKAASSQQVIGQINKAPANVEAIPNLVQSRNRRIVEISLIAVGVIVGVFAIRKLV